MAATEHLISVLLPTGKVLAPIGPGLLLRSVGLFGDREGEVLRKFVVRFALPLFVFFSVSEARPESIAAILPMMAAYVLLTAILFVLGWGAAMLFKEGPQKAM